MGAEHNMVMDRMRQRYPDKFLPEEKIFDRVQKGGRLFVGTGCGEPQHLIRALVDFVESHPMNVIEAELLHVWTLGVAPYTDSKFKKNFRYNTFFIGDSARDAVNKGAADYTPMFLSQVPDLFARGLIPVDIALIQTSTPDEDGRLSLGISVDITKAATGSATTVICQVNSNMPYVHGDTLIDMAEVDFVVPYDEPLLEYETTVSGELAQSIGNHVARIVKDGDTIQVGYGSIPNAVLANLEGKKHLGIHTELLSDGIVDLVKKGVVDNSRKSIDKGKAVATFCMGSTSTYRYIDDNPAFEFRPIDYTNDPLVIARNHNMTAINSALAIDLTGQATAESIGSIFYSGIGGQADFMRGAVLARQGKTILAMESTTSDGKTSRIVPYLHEGSKVTLTAGDIHYVVTEFGIAYLHGKNIRERAMELISIAHPDFRPWLIEEAKRHSLIYADQIFVAGKEGEYPEELERYRVTEGGQEILLRPVKISDEPLLKDFFYSLSDESNYRRFFTLRQYMPHEVLQKFVAIDYTKQMIVLAVVREAEREKVVGVGQYVVLGDTHTADVAVAVRDEYQRKGIGTELLNHLALIAKRDGLHGFSADYIAQNQPINNLIAKSGMDVTKQVSSGVCHVEIPF